MKIKPPDHLGGHLGITHVDKGTLEYFYSDLGCRSLVDIGCGPGGQVYLARDVGYTPVCGVEGDPTLTFKEPNLFVRHDYETGPYVFDIKFDLVWSCEFVEHVKPEYVNNFMSTFNCGSKYVAMTYHPPSKTKNPKHFNEQPEEYWIDIFSKNGWRVNQELTQTARKKSVMKFFKSRGLVFDRVDIN